MTGVTLEFNWEVVDDSGENDGYIEYAAVVKAPMWKAMGALLPKGEKWDIGTFRGMVSWSEPNHCHCAHDCCNCCHSSYYFSENSAGYTTVIRSDSYNR